jgi:hypothetical protein
MPELPRTNEGKRICQVIKVKPEALKEYKEVSHTSYEPFPRSGIEGIGSCGCMA